MTAELTYNVCHVVLAFLYCILLGLAVYLLVGLHPRSDGTKPRPQMFFYVFFITASLGRIVYFALVPILNSEFIAYPFSVNFFLNTSPSFFFFTSFLIVLFLWAELYHNESNRFDFSLQRLTMPLLVINTCMYVYLCVMYMIDFSVSWPWGSGLHTRALPAPTKPSYSETAVLYLIEVMYLSVFVGFVLYGVLIMRKMNRFQNQSRSPGRGQSAYKRVAIITGLNAVAFFARALITLWANIWQTDVYMRNDWIDIAYFTVLELVPLCALMLLLRTKEKPQATAVQSPTRDIFAPSYTSPQGSLYNEVSPLMSRDRV